MSVREDTNTFSVEVYATDNVKLSQLLEAAVNSHSQPRFPGVGESNMECVSSFCKKRCMDLSAKPNATYILDNTRPESNLPEGFKRGSLSISDVATVNKHWPYTIYVGEDYMRQRIENQPTASIVKEDTGEMIAWGILYDYNSVGALHVRAGYRRLGLGSALVCNLAQKSWSVWHHPFAYIEFGNSASQRMFTKLGWRRVSDAYFFFRL